MKAEFKSVISVFMQSGALVCSENVADSQQFPTVQLLAFIQAVLNSAKPFQACINPPLKALHATDWIF